MEDRATEQEWAAEELEGVDLNDRRLNDRFSMTLNRLSANYVAKRTKSSQCRPQRSP